MKYKPLTIETIEGPWGINSSLEAMRLPMNGRRKNDDFTLAGKLIKAGDEHAKSMRGIDIWAKLSFQVGWGIELFTYNIGMDDLSTSSSMHNELKGLKGEELADQKQLDLPDKVYTRIIKVNYQTLRRIYKQRRHHRHPDWHIFCDWIETLPHFYDLIMPEKKEV